MNLVHVIVRFFSGKPGYFIFKSILKYRLVFISLAAIYGFIMFYANYILKYYLPEKVEQFTKKTSKNLIKNNPDITKKQLADEIYQKINDEFFDSIPLFLVIPTEREYWIKKFNYSDFENRVDLKTEVIPNALSQI